MAMDGAAMLQPDQNQNTCIFIAAKACLVTISLAGCVVCAVCSALPMDAGGEFIAHQGRHIPALALLWNAMQSKLSILLLLHAAAWAFIWLAPTMLSLRAGWVAAWSQLLGIDDSDSNSSARTLKLAYRSLGPLVSAAVSVMSLGLVIAWSHGMLSPDSHELGLSKHSLRGKAVSAILAVESRHVHGSTAAAEAVQQLQSTSWHHPPGLQRRSEALLCSSVAQLILVLGWIIWEAVQVAKSSRQARYRAKQVLSCEQDIDATAPGDSCSESASDNHAGSGGGDAEGSMVLSLALHSGSIPRVGDTQQVVVGRDLKQGQQLPVGAASGTIGSCSSSSSSGISDRDRCRSDASHSLQTPSRAASTSGQQGTLEGEGRGNNTPAARSHSSHQVRRGRATSAASASSGPHTPTRPAPRRLGCDECGARAARAAATVLLGQGQGQVQPGRGQHAAATGGPLRNGARGTADSELIRRRTPPAFVPQLRIGDGGPAASGVTSARAGGAARRCTDLELPTSPSGLLGVTSDRRGVMSARSSRGRPVPGSGQSPFTPSMERWLQAAEKRAVGRRDSGTPLVRVRVT